MKYTVTMRENETGKETAYEGDQIICVAIYDAEDGENMVAEGQIDVSDRDFASWLASSDFHDAVLQQLIMHMLGDTLEELMQKDGESQSCPGPYLC